jgi:hypothetical protein
LRRLIAVALALSLLTSSLAGCSQPIDNGSTIPAQSQPIVALLALVAVGFGLAAWDRHNDTHHGGAGPTIIAPAQVIRPSQLLSGYRAADLSIDGFNSGVGVLELPTVSGTPARFLLIVGSSFNDYALTTGYAPVAAAVDGNGNDWFVDSTGHVQGCNAALVGVTTCTTNNPIIPVPTANDGLGTGQRSIAADGFNLVIVRDGGAGKVNWFAFNLSSGATSTGSYQSTSTSGLFAADALASTPPATGTSGFAVFHTDGRSDLITLTPPANSPNFTFAPATLSAPSNQVTDSFTSMFAFCATTGSQAGTYQLTRYENSFAVGIGQLTTTSITIAVNGQTGDPANKPYVLPLTSVHVDTGLNVWALDSNGTNVDIVQFGQF